MAYELVLRVKDSFATGGGAPKHFGAGVGELTTALAVEVAAKLGSVREGHIIAFVWTAKRPSDCEGPVHTPTCRFVRAPPVHRLLKSPRKFSSGIAGPENAVTVCRVGGGGGRCPYLCGKMA